MLVDPDGMNPVLFGILQRTGEVKFGVSRLDESKTVGKYNIVPVYSADNKTLIAYNAGRSLPSGEYRTEYQMEPGDLVSFAKSISTYTAAANLVYNAGEPDWNLVLMSHYGMQGDFANALSSLGQSWANAAKDPSFWISVSLSVVGSTIGKGTNKSSVKSLAKDLKSWLGSDARAILNKSDDLIILSKNGSRRLRFDINNTSPHKNLHSHVEELIDGKWVKSGPLYPKDLPKE